MQDKEIQKQEEWKMHSVLKNAVSTLNYLLLQQSTERLSLPECVIDEISLYIDGLNDLLFQNETEPSLQSLTDEIKEIVKKEIEDGVYLDETPDNVKEAIRKFYENYSNSDKNPSLYFYNSIIDEVAIEREFDKAEMLE